MNKFESLNLVFMINFLFNPLSLFELCDHVYGRIFGFLGIFGMTAVGVKEFGEDLSPSVLQSNRIASHTTITQPYQQVVHYSLFAQLISNNEHIKIASFFLNLEQFSNRWRSRIQKGRKFSWWWMAKGKVCWHLWAILFSLTHTNVYNKS